jgi:ribosomal protein L1
MKSVNFTNACSYKHDGTGKMCMSMKTYEKLKAMEHNMNFGKPLEVIMQEKGKTVDVTKAIKEQKLGKIEYRTEKTGIVQCIIGKKSFGAQKLKENYLALAGAILRAKPPTSKGTYIKKITVSTTMSPGLMVDAMETQSATTGA